MGAPLHHPRRQKANITFLIVVLSKGYLVQIDGNLCDLIQVVILEKFNHNSEIWVMER